MQQRWWSHHKLAPDLTLSVAINTKVSLDGEEETGGGDKKRRLLFLQIFAPSK